jgi:hypothetical protein
MMCTTATPNSDIQRYFTCPLDPQVCGQQTIDVGDSVQQFNMTSNQFNTNYFCIY